MTSMLLKRLSAVVSVIALFIVVGVPFSASAASYDLTTDKERFVIGGTFTVDIKLASSDVGINAAQATLSYPKDIVEITGLDKTNSALDFWLQGPDYSNDAGQLSFIGGSQSGISGKALQVLRVTFKVKGAGPVGIIFVDGAITASDGNGTNVLAAMNGLHLMSITKQDALFIKPPEIVRPAAPAVGLPVKPVITVPLYPDPKSWSAVSSKFFVSWKLPPDVTGVAVVLNNAPALSPDIAQGLFETKEFPPLLDGIYYLHVRFQNAIGWGPAVHYRIAVDTKQPQGFNLNILEGVKTDTPTPTLQFRTSDALSGLREYQVRVGSGALTQIPAASSTGSFMLPLQPPGKQKVTVRAVDQAGNGTEESVSLEVLPLASPAVTFVTGQLFSDDEQSLLVKGTATPGVRVLLRVQKGVQEQDALVAEHGVIVDEQGNWEFTFGNLSLHTGRYAVIVQSQDARGALSLPVSSAEIRVSAKPVIQIGIVALDAGEAALFLLLILIWGFGGGVWYHRRRQEQIVMRVGFAASEISKIFALLTEDIARISGSLKTTTGADDDRALQQLEEHMKKMEVYIKKGVEKIKR